MDLLTPDRYFSRISHIDIERDLLAAGIEAACLDIDNTILTRDTREVPRDVAFWLAKARERGIGFCLVSNNWHSDVFQIAGQLDLPIVAKAVKPSPHGLLLAMRKMESNRQNTVMIGDQLFTDVLAAHLAGMRAFMLQPLVDQDLPHTLMIRNIERVFLRARIPEPAHHARRNAEEANHGR